MSTDDRIASASRVIHADAATIFEFIADPSRQPQWDGNDNLVSAPEGQRVTAIGDVFVMRIHLGSDRENHVVEFDEGRLIAWRPSEPGRAQPGHLWRYALTPGPDGTTTVTHTYDWSELTDENRMARARRTDSAMLRASLDRLAEVVEKPVVEADS